MTTKASEKLKIARGTARKDRSGKVIPARIGFPNKPEWLGLIASAKWDETVLILEAEGLLSPTYGDCIAMYCHAFQDLHNAERVLEAEGEYCHSEKGGIYQHPAVGVRNKAIERILKFGRQLGLTPASIMHVQKNEKHETPSTKKRFFG